GCSTFSSATTDLSMRTPSLLRSHNVHYPDNCCYPTMTKLLTRREKQEQTRERLLEAAASVFARRGYQQASVEEIAAEAGFTTGAVYSNFAGKEELFLALADNQVEKRVAEIRAVADAAERGERAGAEAAYQFRK